MQLNKETGALFYQELCNISLNAKSVEEKREQITHSLIKFDQKNQQIELPDEIKSGNQTIGNEADLLLENLKQKVTHWSSNISDMIQRDNFREKLNESFIVIIYGKVKAGKSSLGNLVAKNNLLSEKPSFFRYDQAGNEESVKKLEELNDESFETNNLECTSSIQGFRLNALAWIDTPGLGSMTVENGALAQKYIDAADYIIFPTSSNAPLQQDEITELKELFEQKKRIALYITKSDTTEKRKDENGKYIKDENGKIVNFRINKTTDDRLKQEAYVKDVIRGLGIVNTEDAIENIISISSFTAQLGLDNQDDVLLNGSNIGLFYDSMLKILANAKEIKMRVPYENLISFIENDLIGLPNSDTTINALKNDIAQFGHTIRETKIKFEDLKQNSDSDIAMEVENTIERYQHEIDKNNSDKIFAQIDEILQESIPKKVEENISTLLSEFACSFEAIEHNRTNSNTFKIEDVVKTIKVRYKNTSWWKKPFVSLGIADDDYDTMRKEVNFGDNKQDVVLNYKQNRKNLYMSQAAENYALIVRNFLAPLDDVYRLIEQNIETLEEELQVLKNELITSKQAL